MKQADVVNLVLDAYIEQKEACAKETGAASARTVVRTILQKLRKQKERSVEPE